MSDRLNTTTKKRQNSDSVFNVSPFQSRGFGVQAKSEESAPVSKAELWESYQQAKQLNQSGANRSSVPIQAKLTIGQPGDKYEKEADSVADQVMAMPEPKLSTSTVTNSVQTRSIQPIQKVSTDTQEDTTEESKQERAEDQIQAKEAISQTPEITSTSAKVTEIPNDSTIQRDSPGSLPPIPNYQLTTPSLLQPSDPSSRHKIGGDMSLQLDPQFQLTIQHVQEQVNISTIRTAISQIDLALPVTYNPTSDPSQLLALPPKPGSKPTQSPDSEATKSEHVDTPDSPKAADASAKPRAGSVGDLLAAGSKVFEKPITFLHTQVKDRLPRDFSKLQAGDIVVGIVTVVPIGAGLLKGLLPNPAARQFALEQLNGKVLPVPGLSWLHLEMNTGKNNLMVGLHVDVGDLLPSSLGFKGSSPDAIGGPPEPEPFSLQRKSDSIEDASSSSSLEDRLNGSKGGGNPLSDDVRSFMEPRFGADFSGVRVHTGSDAVQMNQDVNAQAFAHGSDVYFGAGKAPGKDALTAHELTHVVQQTGGVRRQIIESSHLNSVNISSVKSTGNMIHPDTTHTGETRPQINQKHSFDFGELKGPKKDFHYVNLSTALKAKGSMELMEGDNRGGGIDAPITIGPTGSPKGVGGKVDILLAKQHLQQSIQDWMFEENLKEKMNFELGTEKLDVSVGIEARAKCNKIPILRAAGDLKFIFASVKWEEIKSDPNKVKVLAAEAAFGLEGEGLFEIPMTSGAMAKIKLTGQMVGTASPSWANIGCEVAKGAAQQGVQTAATGATGAATTTSAATATAAVGADTALVIDAGAVASSAATIILPLGAAALMVSGGMQTEKNIRASHAAIAMGVKMRNEAKSYASAYVNTITGGNGSGQGSLDANVKVMQYMAATGKNRADACVDFSQKNGGYSNMYNEIITAFREQVFEKSVAEFEQKFADQFGVLESLGTEWGMRGVFRKDFRRLLYDTW